MSKIQHPIICLLLLLFMLSGCQQVSDPLVRTYFNARGSIQSHPIIENGILYFGSHDGSLYALNASSGETVWEFPTPSPVKCKPAIKGQTVYFFSGNNFYAVETSDGSKKWQKTFDFKSAELLDLWDYHHGSPVLLDDRICYGASNGTLYCLDTENGEILNTFPTVDSAAIHCTPLLEGNILYFGDWNGRVYAYDTKRNDTLWTHRTYLVQPYPTFGQVNASFALKDTLLVFGARNPELRVLDRRTGKLAWNHVETNGGWISGDPLISGDTLYIGGSDCHKMFAFNIRSGELIWEYEFLNANFSAPMIQDNYLVFPSGDAYSVYGSSAGSGYVFALNRFDGSIVNFLKAGGNLYTTPVLQGNKIFLGSDDGNLYALNIKALLYPEHPPESKGYKSIDSLSASPNPFAGSTEISYFLNYSTPVNISIRDLNAVLVFTDSIPASGSGKKSFTWPPEGPHNLPSGYYRVFLASADYEVHSFIQIIPENN